MSETSAGRMLVSSLGNYGKRHTAHAAMMAGGAGLAAYGARDANRRGVNATNGAMMGAGAVAMGAGLHGFGAQRLLSSQGRAGLRARVGQVGRRADKFAQESGEEGAGAFAAYHLRRFGKGGVHLSTSKAAGAQKTAKMAQAARSAGKTPAGSSGRLRGQYEGWSASDRAFMESSDASYDYMAKAGSF